MWSSTDLWPAFVVAALLGLAIAPAATAAANAAAGISTTAIPETTGNDAPVIVSVYPNPASEGDVGEFVVVRFPAETNGSNWSVGDGESTVWLPNVTLSGRVALSDDPQLARNRTDVRVLALADDLSLANSGETIRVAGGNATASVSYADAPEAERWHRTETGGDWQWTPLGATDFEISRTGPADATAFVLPDAPGVPVETLRAADRRILLAGYTFASARVADALAAAVRRGVAVRVLVDAEPVGGITRREADLLDSLVARGVEVRVLGDRVARYDFHHAKYAVADDRALVMTENWKPAGTGGHSSRGWGVVVRDAATADRLAAVFEADAGWRGATPWSEFRRAERFQSAGVANGSYPSKVGPKHVAVSNVTVLIAPDNAETALVSLLDSADESIRVQQVAVGGRHQPFLRATLRAARRGVEVRLLLSSARYVVEDNRALVEWLNGVAESEGLPLEARMADPRGRYGKIHAKGVVVDGEAAVVGSLNWNNHSARKNREVAVVLRSEEVGSYYGDVFDADWRASAGRGKRLPVGLLVAVAVGAVAALLLAEREVKFS